MDAFPLLGSPSRRIDPGGEPHPLITIHQAAQALGFSDMTIRRKIEARQFPAVKMGCKALVPRAFVEQLIADALTGKTVVVEEYTAAWSQNRGGHRPSISNVPADSDATDPVERGDMA